MKGKMETLEKFVKWIEREQQYCDACSEEIEMGLAPYADVSIEEWQARWHSLDKAKEALKEFKGIWEGTIPLKDLK